MRITRNTLLWMVLFIFATTVDAQIPKAIVPQGVGVNIHFITGQTNDLDMIADAGFKFIRMDFMWEHTEPKPGQYFWKGYDELTANLDKRGIRALYILDYTNPAYEKEGSPRHPESVAAFARWAAEAAKRYSGRHIMWEIYNEPNGFWKPKPDAQQYTALALATAKAIREADPTATIVAPGLAGFDWSWFETLFKSGILQYLDAVSVHPYRDVKMPPETAAPDYKKLREIIDRYSPKRKLPILSGEWGYPTHNGGVSLETQAAYIVRQQLSNLLNDVPLSIWYDWKNDGPDPNYNENNFGTVDQNLKPKPAYSALRNMVRELDGYRFSRRVHLPNKNDYVLAFQLSHAEKVVAWTTEAPHEVQIPGMRTKLELGPVPKFIWEGSDKSSK